jgi:hypothetical protein
LVVPVLLAAVDAPVVRHAPPIRLRRALVGIFALLGRLTPAPGVVMMMVMLVQRLCPKVVHIRIAVLPDRGIRLSEVDDLLRKGRLVKSTRRWRTSLVVLNDDCIVVY